MNDVEEDDEVDDDEDVERRGKCLSAEADEA